MLHKENYKCIKPIGQGGYASVYLYFDEIGQRKVAIKKVKVRNQEELDSVKNEINILEDLCHPNIINYYGYFYDELNCEINIVMEYASGGTLKEIIEKRKEKFKEDEILGYFTQICEGLNYIHQKKIIHRDLNPINILLCNGKVKIVDFGISKKLLNNEFAKTVIGKDFYLSPEIILEQEYSFETDIWSLGLIMYELLSLQKAFKANNVNVLNEKIIKGKYPPITDEQYSTDLKTILSKCLNPIPRERPKIGEILKLPIISHYIEKNSNKNDEYFEEDEKEEVDNEIIEDNQGKKQENGNLWSNCLFVRDEKYRKNYKTDKKIIFSDLIPTTKYLIGCIDQTNIIIYANNQTFEPEFQNKPSICKACSYFLHPLKKDSSRQRPMLRVFQTFESLQNHLKNANESIEGCIINVKLDPDSWKLIRLKRNSNYYYIKKDDLEMEYSDVENKGDSLPKYEYIDLF